MLRLSYNAVITKTTQTNGRLLPCVPLLLKQASYRSTIAATTQDTEWLSARPFEDIPGPKAFPVIGNGWRFLPHIGEYGNLNLSQLHKKYQQQYGNIVKVTGIPGSRDQVYLFNPEEIEKTLRNEGKWPERDFTPSFTYYRNVTRKDLFQGVGSILATQGEEWQKFRSKVNPAMMQPRNAKLYVEPIDKVSKDFIKRIRKLKNEKEEMPEHFINELQRWALESIGLIALDKRLGCLENNLRPDSEQQRMIVAAVEIIEDMYALDFGVSYWKYISTPAWRKFVKNMDCFTEVAWKYVAEAMKRVQSRPLDKEGDVSILERILINEADPRIAFVTALDLLFGGIDTTAVAAAVLLYYLAINPDKQQKLYEELKLLLPKPETETITDEKLEAMKYLKACMKESLRLSPPAFGNARTLNKDMVLSNYKVPKGTNVFMMHMQLSNQEKYFRDADKYVPERWLKGPNGEQAEYKSTHPFVYMPFGFGPRMCLGRRFAELETQTVVARIIRNFNIEYNYGEMKFSHKLLYKPASPLRFKMMDRE